MPFRWRRILTYSLFSVLTHGFVASEDELISVDLSPITISSPSLAQRRAKLRVKAALQTTTDQEPWNVYMGPMGEGAVRAAHVYSSEIKLGQGFQEQGFNVLFDTGSSHLVVPDQHCRDQSCLSHKRYTNRSLALGAKQEVHYAYGKMQTIPYSDTLCFGADSLCIKNSRVLSAISEEAGAMGGFAFDGILGLAPLSNFTENVLRHSNRLGRSVRPVFALYLSRDERIRKSEMTIGGYRPSLLGGALKWLPQYGLPGKWAFQIKDISIGGRRLYLCGYGKSECRAIVDSGTSQIVAPPAWAEKVKKRMNVNFDCGKNNKLPPMTILTQSGETFNIGPEDYVHRMTPTSGCFPAVAPVEGFSDDTVLLGLPFLRKFYSVYDIEKNMVGIGEARLPGAHATETPDIPRVHLVSGSKRQRVSGASHALHVAVAFLLFFLLSSGAWVILRPAKDLQTLGPAYESPSFVFGFVR